jgi:hypothetical protein
MSIVSASTYNPARRRPAASQLGSGSPSGRPQANQLGYAAFSGASTMLHQPNTALIVFYA